MKTRANMPVLEAIGIGLAAALCTVAAGGARLPPGFSSTTVASGFERPVGIAFTGDGRMFVAEQGGMIWVVQEGETLPEPFIDLHEEVNGPWDRGMLGIALDPDFLSNRHVYLLYTADPVPGEPDEPPEQRVRIKHPGIAMDARPWPAPNGQGRRRRPRGGEGPARHVLIEQGSGLPPAWPEWQALPFRRRQALGGGERSQRARLCRARFV
jgi:hypothetical protein